MAQWNPFPGKIRICNSGEDSSQKGNVSFILSFPRFKISSILHFNNDRGIFPCIWLWLKSNVFKLLPSINVSGKFPWNRLFLKFKTKRELLKSPKHCGIWPINWLLDISSTWRDFIWHIIGGTVPVRLFFEAKKYTRDSGRVISDPPNLLELRSEKFIIFQGRMGGCSKMLKLLWERSRYINVSFPTFQNHLGTLAFNFVVGKV